MSRPVRLAAALLVVLGLLGLHTQAWAEQGDWTRSAVFEVGRAAADMDDGTGGVSGLSMRLGAGISAERARKLAPGRSDLLSFGLTVEQFPEARSADRQHLDLAYEYRLALGGNGRRQLRYRLEATVARDGTEHVFSRVRAAAAVRTTFRPGNAVQWRVRAGYRDQNDARFTGFDQWELMADMSWFWRDASQRFSGLVTVYTDWRHADDDIHSHSETGLRLIARQHLSDDLAIAVRANGFRRLYHEGGRKDHRLSLMVGPEIRLSPNVSLDLHVGYQKHSSTRIDRRHSGPIAGVALTWTW
ncbi:hypothetical protein [Pseudogemmobacter humi]|uniref:Uncharacterized protein n=1 Tax=Pseudogemmobacter humi TaxID=2483812 RepID=A0A3P5WXG2_9RHOB|nr:hypothetical protein [Pseudogemmobacter humi]VDC23741.1 hypothetical protein XINFAN_01161 [Pseudogemmobacter humi]